MVSRVAEANGVEMPNSFTSSQKMMDRTRRSPVAHDDAGYAANPGYRVHPFALRYCHAFHASNSARSPRNTLAAAGFVSSSARESIPHSALMKSAACSGVLHSVP